MPSSATVSPDTLSNTNPYTHFSNLIHQATFESDPLSVNQSQFVLLKGQRHQQGQSGVLDGVGAKVYTQNQNQRTQTVVTKSQYKQALSRFYELGGQAFGGNSQSAPEPAFHWSLGQEIGNTSEKMDSEDRWKVVLFIARIALYQSCIGCSRSGVTQVIGLRSTQSTLSNGHGSSSNAISTFHAFASLILYPTSKGYTGPLVSNTKLVCNLFCLQGEFFNLPPMMNDSKRKPEQDQLTKRGNLFEKLNVEFHHKVCDNRPHVYLFMLAVDPKCQGQGMGKKLLNKLHEISDSMNLPVYLECAGSKNKSIYEKNGYTVKDQFLCEIEEDKMYNWESPMLYCMLREVGGK